MSVSEHCDTVILGGIVTKMKKAVVSVILSLIGGIVGFFMGTGLNQPVEMMMFGAFVVGIGCIVYAIDSKK